MCAAAYRFEAFMPADCSAQGLEQFATLVASGGEVAQGLQNRLKRALSLATLMYGESIVGTAAIKRPFATYRNKVFQSARSPLAATDFGHELGWIFIDPAHRGKGHTFPLIEAALVALEGGPAYATTRLDNEPMHHVLQNLHFERSGVPYASAQHAGQDIVLYVRLPRAAR